ncbi:unnamed protein product [Dovyalis caffra]|uniref:RRM domain-containing protein n=1 Tax=Dovyalis caffra TaxID=77055 RepID=A0AAV1RWU6_9ROSI|nr:unnamed protein product [Dovyalis caffra]
MAAFPSPQNVMNTQMQKFGFQSSEVKPESAEAQVIVTLLIKHLPEAIPFDTLSRLFSHYGAASVRPCNSGRLKNCAFVDFKSEGLAYQAHRQLNGLRFLGKVLSVERASKLNEDSRFKQSEAQQGKDSILPTSLMKDASVTRDVLEGSKFGSLPAREPIAPRLGVDYPFPPHLEYAYPPPDGNILTNIVNALIAVPRFYTQVLHLMNKMNIPAPFRMALPTPPLPPPATPPPPPPPPCISEKTLLAEQSSSESEMESADEEVDNKGSYGASGAVKSRRKRIKREAVVGPAVDKDVAHEAVGLRPASLVPKEIPFIKKKNPVLQIKIVPKVIQNEHKDDSIMTKSEEPDTESSDQKHYATAEEIESKRLAPEEILSLPKFKNYTVGNPAPVLYIKNLDKEVVADDFFYIFGSLFGSIDAAKTGLSVKLMQEGRMRGQAFVTFPSVELAHQALNLVNGYDFSVGLSILKWGIVSMMHFKINISWLYLVDIDLNQRNLGISGTQFHSLTFKVGLQYQVYVQTALLNMYLTSGVLGDAMILFDQMPERNVVTWNVMITGLVKWGKLESASFLFDEMPEKNVVSWTGIIDGYIRNNNYSEGLSLFQRMFVCEGIKPTEITILAILPAISNTGELKVCSLIHGYAEKRGFNAFDIRVSNSILDTYSKCGCIASALKFFEDISVERKNLVSWTSIISGFAMHGMWKEAVEYFERMEKAGLKPNRVTFLSVLNACSHGGLVDEGLRFFDEMVSEHGVSPDIKHYGCLVDMLGRTGRLEEAEKIALEIPTEIVNVVIWRTLLGACSFHGNVEMGKRVTRKIMEMERGYGGDYVLMYNIFAGAGRFEDAERLRRLMNERNAFKPPGNSLVPGPEERPKKDMGAVEPSRNQKSVHHHSSEMHVPLSFLFFTALAVKM